MSGRFIRFSIGLSILISANSYAVENSYSGATAEACLNRLYSYNKPGDQTVCPPGGIFSALDLVQARLNCLEAICPNGLGEMTKIEGRKSDLSLVGKADRQKLDQLLTAHYSKALAEELVQLKNAKSRLDNKKPLSDPEQIKVARMMSLLSKVPRASVTAKGIDQKETKENIPDITAQELAGVSYAIDFEIKASKANLPIINEDLQHLSRNWTSQQMQQATLAALNQYKANIDSLIRKSNLPDTERTTDPIYSGALGQRLKEGSFSLADIETFRVAYKGARLRNWAWDDKKMQTYIPIDPVKIEPVIADDGGQLLKARIGLIESYLQDPKNKSNALYNWLDDIKNNCASEVAYARQILPTSKAQEEFRKKELQWRDEFVAGLNKKMSKSTAKMLAQAAQNWKMALPPTAEDQFQSILQPLKDDIEAADVQLDDRNMQLKFALWLGTQSDFYGEPNYGQETLKICEKAAVSLLSDHVQTGSDKFALGPVFGLGEEWAKSIAFHEYGHLISGIMQNGKSSKESKAWFERSRKCLKEMQPQDEHVEEDWADMLSASMGTVNRRCYTMDSTNTLPISNTGGADQTHSTDFFRALHHEVIQKGSIPVQCQSFMVKGTEQVKIKSCL